MTNENKWKKLTFHQMELLRELYLLEMSIPNMAKYFEVAPSSVFRNIQKMGLTDKRKSSHEIVKLYREQKSKAQEEVIKRFENENNLT